MKPSKTSIYIFLLVAVLIAIKFVFLNNSPAKNTQPVAGRNAPLTVTAYITSFEKLQNKIYASGTVMANEEVELRPEASGKILNVYFKEGSHVNKGDLLIKINDADLQAQLKKLRLQSKLAGEQSERQKKLLDISGISQEEYDIAINQLNSLKADEDYTIAQISKTELRAPFSGVIGLKNISEGSYVSPAQSIAWLQQIDPVKIDFSIPEKYAGLVKKGDKINFYTSESNDTASGDVYAIQPRINDATRTLQIRAVSPNKEGRIIPGAFVRIELVLKEIKNAILIPTEAIVPILKGKNVFVYSNGKARAQKIETGIRTDTRVEVLNGINEGDTIITSGMMQIRDTMNVKISELKTGITK